MNMLMREKKNGPRAALLFAACPNCVVGDLAIVLVDGKYIGSCLQCKHVGVLCSVYPSANAMGERLRELSA